jgi:hypothetical protein
MRRLFGFLIIAVHIARIEHIASVDTDKYYVIQRRWTLILLLEIHRPFY